MEDGLEYDRENPPLMLIQMHFVTSREAARSREGVVFPEEEEDVCQFFASCSRRALVIAGSYA